MSRPFVDQLTKCLQILKGHNELYKQSAACIELFHVLDLENEGQDHFTKIALSPSFDEILTSGLMHSIASLMGHAVTIRSHDLDLKVKVKQTTNFGIPGNLKRNFVIYRSCVDF
jgi:hypothetical protein